MSAPSPVCQEDILLTEPVEGRNESVTLIQTVRFINLFLEEKENVALRLLTTHPAGQLTLDFSLIEGLLLLLGTL